MTDELRARKVCLKHGMYDDDFCPTCGNVDLSKPITPLPEKVIGHLTVGRVRKYRIIGFNDIIDKPRGPRHMFREEDCFETEQVPTEKELRAYCVKKGYLPRRMVKGMSPTQCQPVYICHEDVPLASSARNPLKPDRHAPANEALRQFHSRHDIR